MKYIFLTIILLLIFSLSICEEIALNDQVTGTSTNAYVETTIYTGRTIYKSLIIKNTGGTNSLTYYVHCFPYESGSAYYTFASGALTNGLQANCFINNIYYKIIIGIKSTSSSAHSTYSVDYIKR